jgi:hypothetical protein
VPQKTKSSKLRRFSWFRFDPRKTREAGGTIDFMLRAHVSLTMHAGSTHREDLEQMARTASQPFSIVSVPQVLDERKSLRGTVYFGEVGTQIDKIARNYQDMRWWMEKGGLVVDRVPPKAVRLSEFDRKAGKLTCERTVNGKLSAEAIVEVAAQLDAAGFILRENLQPAQWKPIAAFNQKYAKSAVKSFTAAASHSKFNRAVRRRLYTARDRYEAPYKLSS